MQGISRINTLLPDYQPFFTNGDSHSLSPNDEFLPNSTRLSLKAALANPGCTLFQAHSSQLAKRHPAASVRFAAIGVLIDPLAYLS
jgi:hypothetical protein